MPKQSRPFRIGIDLMGHDNAPEVLLAALRQLALPEHAQIVAIGKPEYASLAGPFAYHSAPEVIEMDDSPLEAIRKKKNSSLCVGLRLLKAKEIDAFISAGNTGALVSASKIILRMQPRFSRPALLTLLPTKKRPLAVLDVGANTEVKAAHYVQFALMGAAYQRSHGVELPKVGLLNIGSEPTKGTAELRRAYKELEALPSSHLRFVGNVEGRAAFEGDLDVLVTDGFTGNIFLKTAEGIASFLLDQLCQHLPENTAGSELCAVKRRMHYAEYPGALLTGVQGIVFKCHGSSDPQNFVRTIQMIFPLFESTRKSFPNTV